MSADRRRGVLKKLTVGIGAALAAALAWPIGRYVAFPARQRTVFGPVEPIVVAKAAAVVAGQPPLRVIIVAGEQRDAWTRARSVPLGAAWLVCDARGNIRAFSSACPHLGCAVDYDARAGVFACPCHQSSFGRGGERLAGPARRGLDPLDVVVQDGNVLVRYQRFVASTAERKKA